MLKTSAAHASAGGLLLCALLLAGCATGLQSDDVSRAAFPRAVELTEVVFFPQEKYQCGPAALAMALHWAGKPVTPQALTPQVYLPAKQGSLQVELLANARRHGTVAYVLRPRLTDLLAEISAGHPVIVFQNLGLSWYPKWHYAVVVGFDLAADQIVLRSGLEARHVVPLAVFERTWRRGNYWAVTLLPPARLPRTAEEAPYLQAVIALERLEYWQEASAAYRAALERWPDSLVAQLGLGNSRYGLRDFVGAERAYRAAAETHPTSGVVHNNLAQALADQERWSEAEAAVQRALALGGPHEAVFRATLAQIRARRPSKARPGG